MGGALEALGADVSTISSNPAGIGLFRHNNISVSGGLVVQGNGTAFSNGKKTNASFDQIGGVYSMRTGRTSYLNFGFNYHKGRNFDYILNAANALNGSSLNNQSYAKGHPCATLLNREPVGHHSTAWRPAHTIKPTHKEV